MAYAQVAMAGLQVVGGYFKSEAAKESAKLNRKISEMNAEFAELDAYNAKTEGFGEIARYQKVIDQTLSEQQANLAAADVDVNYGSAADIQSESRFIGEMNKMEMEKQAEEGAAGFKQQASQYRMNAGIAYARETAVAKQHLTQGLMQGASTGLSGYSNHIRRNGV